MFRECRWNERKIETDTRPALQARPENQWVKVIPSAKASTESLNALRS